MGIISLTPTVKKKSNSLLSGIQKIGGTTLQFIYGTKEKPKIKSKAGIFLQPVKQATRITGIGTAIGVTAPALVGTTAGKAIGTKLGAGAVTASTLAILAPKTTKNILKQPDLAAPLIAGTVAGTGVGLAVGAERGAGLGGKIKDVVSNLSTGQKIAAGVAGVTALGAGALAIPKVRETASNLIGKLKTSKTASPVTASPVLSSNIPSTSPSAVKTPVEATQASKNGLGGVNIKITNKLTQKQKVYKRGSTRTINVYAKKIKKRKASRRRKSR